MLSRFVTTPASVMKEAISLFLEAVLKCLGLLIVFTELKLPKLFTTCILNLTLTSLLKRNWLLKMEQI